MPQSPLPRPLTDQEKEWLKQALALLPTGEYFGGGRWVDALTGEVAPPDPPIDPEPYLKQLDSLMVVGRCQCGDPRCHTVWFQPQRCRSYVLVHTSTGDGRELVVFVDSEGRLTELEVI